MVESIESLHAKLQAHSLPKASQGKILKEGQARICLSGLTHARNRPWSSPKRELVRRLKHLPIGKVLIEPVGLGTVTAFELTNQIRSLGPVGRQPLTAVEERKDGSAGIETPDAVGLPASNKRVENRAQFASKPPSSTKR